ncbi:unnamed protein product, partial [Amoebophrya sp. A120]
RARSKARKEADKQAKLAEKKRKDDEKEAKRLKDVFYGHAKPKTILDIVKKQEWRRQCAADTERRTAAYYAKVAAEQQQERQQRAASLSRAGPPGKNLLNRGDAPAAAVPVLGVRRAGGPDPRPPAATTGRERPACQSGLTGRKLIHQPSVATPRAAPAPQPPGGTTRGLLVISGATSRGAAAVGGENRKTAPAGALGKRPVVGAAVVGRDIRGENATGPTRPVLGAAAASKNGPRRGPTNHSLAGAAVSTRGAQQEIKEVINAVVTTRPPVPATTVSQMPNATALPSVSRQRRTTTPC